MRGAPGAIDHVSVEDGKLKLHVIGDGIPTGICGSGLLDLVACLLDLGIISNGDVWKSQPNGRMNLRKPTVHAL